MRFFGEVGVALAVFENAYAAAMMRGHLHCCWGSNGAISLAFQFARKGNITSLCNPFACCFQVALVLIDEVSGKM